MIFLLLFSFLSGVVIIFSPCIWPILPIILSSGASGERRPLGVILGLAVSFTFFTLALASLLNVFPVDAATLRFVAVSVIFLFGVVLLFPALGKTLEGGISRLSGGSTLLKSRSGLKGGFLTGLALGLVWSPCAGPILATVSSLSATQGVSGVTFLVTVAFIAGVSLPLFVLTVLGQRFFFQAKKLSPYTGRVQQIFGIIVILSALAIATGYDVKLQARFDQFCAENNITFLNRFQTNPLVTGELKSLQEER